MEIFAKSILKSLGDLVCYITVNMQAFMQDTKTEEMFVCNSADYSMFYPMVGAFNFINLDNKQDKVVYDFDKKSMYLSCSVKEVQNFFVPLTLKEKHKLYLVRQLREKHSDSLVFLSDILFFGEKYKAGTNLDIFKELCKEGECNLSDGLIFSEENYKIIKEWYQEQDSNNVLKIILEDYLLYCYLSKLYLYKNEDKDKKEIEKKEILELKQLLEEKEADKLEEIKDLNKELFNEDLIPTLQGVKKNLKILMNESYEDINESNEEDNNNNKKRAELKQLRMDEVKSSFFDKEIVQYAEFRLPLDEWKAFYIYAEYLCEFPNEDFLKNNKINTSVDELADSFGKASIKEGGIEEEHLGSVTGVIKEGGKKSKKTKTKKQHKKKGGTRKNK